MGASACQGEGACWQTAAGTGIKDNSCLGDWGKGKLSGGVVFGIVSFALLSILAHDCSSGTPVMISLLGTFSV